MMLFPLTKMASSSYDNKFQISDLGQNKFLFTFEEIQHAKEVVAKAPWYVMNRLLLFAVLDT